MEPVGGRSTPLPSALVAVALVLALASALTACGSDDEVERAGTSTSSSQPTVAGDDADPTTSTSEGDATTTTAGRSTTTTTSANTTTTTRAPTTTRSPTTTAASAPTTTTAPPRTTTTTAPPPPPPTTTTTAPPSSGTQHGTRNTACEQYMYDRINRARANAGRPALAFDSGIQYIPVDWSDELARSQTLRHNPDYGNQIFAARAQAQTAGENVGRGYSNESLFEAFMNSPGHRQNIESGAFSHVTIGCVNDSSGQIWVSQNFWG